VVPIQAIALLHYLSRCCQQVDHNWQIFAQCVNVCFMQLRENYRSSPHFLGYFIQRLGLCINFDKKPGCVAFWVTFSQTHLVTLVVNKPCQAAAQIKFYDDNSFLPETRVTRSQSYNRE
jgi:hypothetical protein